MNEIKSDFDFKDERRYVHSSTICDEIINKVCPTFYIDPKTAVLDAKFHRFFNKNGTFLCQEKPFNEHLIASAVAEFRLKTQNKTMYILLQDDGNEILKRTKSNYDVTDVKLLKPYSGSAKIFIDGYTQFFSNIIEANKRIHQMSILNDGAKVANVYMKKLPLDIPFNKIDHTIVSVENISIRKHSTGLLTLNKINIMGSNFHLDVCFFVG